MTSERTKKPQKHARYEEWIGAAVFFGMVCLLPLFITSRGYRTITQDKYYFLIIYVAVCLIACFSLAVRRFINVKTGERILPPIRRLRLADIGALLYLLACILSFAAADDRVIALHGLAQRNDGLLTQIAYVSVYFIISRLYASNRGGPIILAVSAGLVSIYAILQFFGVDPLRLFQYEAYPAITGYMYNRFTIPYRSTIGNINILSTFACVMAVFFGINFIISANDRKRWVWFGAGTISVYTLFIASSDSGIVGLFGAFFLLIPWLIDSPEKLRRLFIIGFVYSACILAFQYYKSVYGLRLITIGQWAGSLWMVAFIVCVLLYAIVVIIEKTAAFSMPSPEKMRKIGCFLLITLALLGLAAVELLGARQSSGTIYEIRQVLHGNLSDRFGSSRMFIWKRAVNVAMAHPVLGTGPDSFFQAFAPYQQEALAVTDVYFDKAHNEYLQILVCTGFAGLISYLLLLIGALKRGFARLKKDRSVQPYLATVIAYLIQAFFNISVPITAPLLWVFFGVLAGWEEKNSVN